MGNVTCFCSKFHTLSSHTKILKIGYDLTKLETVKRHSVVMYVKRAFGSRNVPLRFINIYDCKIVLAVSLVNSSSSHG